MAKTSKSDELADLYLKILDATKDFPLLYDITNKSYKNNGVKSIIWKQITDKLNETYHLTLTSEKVQYYFKKAKAKLRDTSAPSGSAAMKLKDREHLKELQNVGSYILDKIQDSVTEDTMSEEESSNFHFNISPIETTSTQLNSPIGCKSPTQALSPIQVTSPTQATSTIQVKSPTQATSPIQVISPIQVSSQIGCSSSNFKIKSTEFPLRKKTRVDETSALTDAMNKKNDLLAKGISTIFTEEQPRKEHTDADYFCMSLANQLNAMPKKKRVMLMTELQHIVAENTED